MNRTLRLRCERLEAFAGQQGWTTRKGNINKARLAEAFAMDRVTVWRVLTKDTGVTARFVAHALTATNLTFDELFEVVDADDEAERAAS